MRLASGSAWAGSLAVLSLLAALLALALSVAALVRTGGYRLTLVRDLGAMWGLATFLTADFIALWSLPAETAQREIAPGFVVLLAGFLMLCASALRPQTIFTPLTCALLATGSVIVGLAWVFFDFFAGWVFLDVSGWVPLFTLLAVVALLMTRRGQWAATALAAPLVIVALYGLSSLLLGIGTLAFMPAAIKIATASLIIILLNSAVIWLTRRRLASGRREAPGEEAPLNRRAFLGVLTRSVASLALGGLFLKAYVWDDPSKQWLLSDLFPHDEGASKLTLASRSGMVLTDASHLNSSVVAEIRYPTTVAGIGAAISDAKASGRKISLSGVRHSMGGQALGAKTLHLDMTHMDSARYNAVDQTVTVGPGATWKQVQAALSPHGRAVRVMQDSNIFTIGGSLSVNVHGKDSHYGSLIE
ncbi:MAG TPA: FAD-dependent oxidoreductase, partial [Ktedonobacterales bacterium]